MSSFRRPEQYAAAILIPLLACVAPAVSGRAQGPTDGALRGRVLDGSGQAVAGSRILLRSLETGEARALATQADGSWLLPHLAPGRYRVSVVLAGFATQSFSPVEVTLGQTTELAATLRPVAEPTTIQVEPTAEITPDAGVEGSISAGELLSLPSAGLRWQDFALTQPGVAPDEDADGLLSVHGLPSTQNAVLVDGADATQNYASVPSGSGSDPAPNPDEDADSAELTTGPSQGLARGRHAGAAYSFSQAAVRQFRMAALGYSAQTGRAAGGVVTTVSRAGTAQWHGSLATTLRASALAAKNALSVATSYRDGVIGSAVVKPHDLRYNFAASLGGPVPAARVSWLRGLYFFYTADGQRRGFPAISSPANPNFYRLTAIQQALLATRGLSRTQVNAGLNYLSSLTGPVDRRADQTIHFGRLDWQPHPGLTFGAQWNRVRWNSPAGLTGSPVVARARASLGNSQGSLDTVLGRMTAALNAHTVNEIRFVYGRDLQFETAQPNLPQEPAIGPPAQPGGRPQAPEVVIGPNGLLFGTPADVSRQALPDENRFQVADTLTLARGHHLLELGGEVELVEDRIATLANSAGTFRYDSGGTRGYAGGLVDFLSDYAFNVNTNPNGVCPSIAAATHLFCFRSFTQSFGLAEVDFRTAHFAGFAEDTWRPLPTLSLHAGLRYDYTLLPVPQRPNGTLDAIFGARGATSIFPEDRNNLGPRLSFAWQPRRLGTLRGGYGLFYGRLPGSIVRAALSDTALPTATTRLRLTPAAVVDCPQVANQGFGYPCDFLAAPTGVVANTASAVVFDRRFRLPAVQQGSLSFERSIAKRTSVSLGGVLNLDRQLATTTDLNIAPATRTMTYQLVGGPGGAGDQRGIAPGELFVLPFYTARVTPNFGPVTQLRSSANASYFALVASVAARTGRTLAVRANYTWAKAIDYGPTQSATPRTNAQLDPFVNGYDKGRSALDYPHLAHATVLLTPQPSFDHPLLRRLTAHWELAALIAARSGRPYTYDLFGGTRLNGGHTSLNGAGGALYLPTVGRNTLRLPPVVNVDLRVARTLALGGHVHLRASAEAFNLFNHRQLTAVSQRAYVVGTAVAGVTPLTFQDAAAIATAGTNTQPFGTPTASGSGLSRERHLQFNLRAEF